jgi:hypothetical protein
MRIEAFGSSAHDTLMPVALEDALSEPIACEQLGHSSILLTISTFRAS